MRSIEPIEVPPNFWTIKAISGAACRERARGDKRVFGGRRLAGSW
jgi:hypothetical protein